MHRHCNVLPLVRVNSQRRCAHNAAQLKPRPTQGDLSSSNGQGGLGKWASPSAETGSSAQGFKGDWSSRPRSNSSNGAKRPVPGKWADFEPLMPSNSTKQTRPGTQRQASQSRADLRWDTLTGPSSRGDRTNPSRPPSASSMKKWQSGPSNTRERPQHTQLQRQRAPHQDPSAVNVKAKTQPTQREPSLSRRPREDAEEVSPFDKRFVEYDASDRGARRDTRVNRGRDNFKGRDSGSRKSVFDSASGRFAQEQDVQEQKTVKKKTIKTKVVEKKVVRDIYIPSTVSVGALARLLGVKLEVLQRKMQNAGMGDEAEYDHVLTSEYAALIAEEFGRNAIVSDEAAFDIYPPPATTDSSKLKPRPPVVTIMGHVDHGKTTLLDNLRSASVAAGEAGGITQHIGAFSVPVPSSTGGKSQSTITFLDTPGHAAFSAMRARGASVTDIIVLVVAADDGIMPQTREVINLINKDKGKVSVVVAINKVDKPSANPDAVREALFAENIHLEELGGDIPSVEVSGLTGQGLPTLMETLSAVAELQDLRSEFDGGVQGCVLESKVEKGLGPVSTVLVLRGCLKPGLHLIGGTHHAKVRLMRDSNGKAVKEAYPGMAVTVTGWKSLPSAGDEVLSGTEPDVKKAIANRERRAQMESSLADVEVINQARRLERERRSQELAQQNSGEQAATAPPTQEETGPKQLRLIIKADVSGSAEAVAGALQGIGNKEAMTSVISTGVGEVTESDITLAKAIGATVVAFSVPVPRSVQSLATQNEVPICTSNVIYTLMDDVKERVIDMLPKVVETKVTGEATILQLFDIHLKAKQTKKVAGCRVSNGVVDKSKFARLVREGVTIHDGNLDTMRILKKDVMEVRRGIECGLCFGVSFGDLREGDLIQSYERIEKRGTL